MKKPLTDKDGEVRELTAADMKHFRPIQETDPGMLEAVAYYGSGNVFRDFGYPDAEVRQAKALLAAEIIKVLDEEGLTARQAAAKTSIAHTEFSRIRNVKLECFTFDRLLAILDKLAR